MISSIFEKTKPINFIIVFAFLFVFYWLTYFFGFKSGYSVDGFLWRLFVLGVLLLSLFLVNFICHRNKITGTNSYALFFYTLLMLVFPETMMDDKAVCCNFFLLLGTQRLISLKTLKGVKLKIFEATLWILVSSLFYNWAVLYLLLVAAAIYTYEPENFRNWLVPFSAAFSVFAIAFAVLSVLGKTNLLDHWATFQLGFDPTYFLDWGNTSRLLVYIAATLLAGLLAPLRLGNTGLGKVLTMRLIALAFVIGIVLKLFVTSDSAYPVVLTFFPAAVFMTNYLESLKKANIKELVLIVSVLVPVLVFLVGINS